MQEQINLFQLHKELAKEAVEELLEEYKDNPIMLKKIKEVQEKKCKS